MNYLKELNAFYDQQDTNPLSASAVAVWHALMHLSHKSGWPDELSVAVSVIMLRAGVKERTFYNARNELKQKGYIDFSSRPGNQAAIYSLRSLVKNDEVDAKEEKEVSGSHAVTVNVAGSLAADNQAVSDTSSIAESDIDTHNDADTTADRVAGSVSPFIKEVKKRNKKDNNNPFCFFEENGFGILPPYIADEINNWLSESIFQEPELIIIEAMKVALERNVRNWRYVSKVLQDWQQRELLTIREVHNYQQSRQSRVTPFTNRKGESPDDSSKESPSTDYSEYDFGF